MAGYVSEGGKTHVLYKQDMCRKRPFDETTPPKHALDASSAHNELLLLANAYLHKESQTGRQSRQSHGDNRTDVPSARGYPAVTKVTKAARPASLAAAKASSTLPPIPRLMAATFGLMMLVSATFSADAAGSTAAAAAALDLQFPMFCRHVTSSYRSGCGVEVGESLTLVRFRC